MSTSSALSKYKFLGLFPLVMAQIGTSGDNSVLTVATASLLASLNATMSDIQLANIIYSLCAGCLMIVGGMVGLIVGWKKNFRIGRRRTCRSFLRQHFYVHLGRPSAGRYRRQFPYPFCTRADPRFVSGQ